MKTLKSNGILEGILLILAFFMVQSVNSFAGARRFYEPIILNGSAFMPDYDQAPLKSLKLFSYHQSTDSWTEIPFQIDERDSNWAYFKESDSLFDKTDELSFLAKDCGDYAVPERWIDDTLSIAFRRFQIMVIDTVAFDTSYAYLYRTTDTTAIDTTHDYMYYDRDNDRVISDYYEYGHDLEGLFTNLLIRPEAGGDSVDILDRLKLRLTGTGDYNGLTLTVNLTEENIKKETSIGNNGINARDGKIRVIRRWNVMIDLGITFIPPFGPYDFTFKFYPYYCDYGSSTLSVSQDVVLKYVRYSFDLDPDANGMKMFTRNAMADFPDGVLIDNNDDVGIPRNLNIPGWNWWMQTGMPGTMLVINNLPNIEGAQGYLYYKDSPTGTNDPLQYDSGDTGYDGSWGDTGIKYSGTIQGSFPLGAKLFFLGPNLSPDSAQAIQDLVATPLKTLVSSSIYVPVELASFRAVTSKDKVILTWTTASETNNLGFAVQRKRQNEALWQRIGFVKGAGTTSEPQSYTFQDEADATGTISYRLKQIDTDGSFEYSEPISVKIKAPEQFTLEQNYPNPFNPSTTISYEVPGLAKGKVNITIYDMLGRKVRTLLDRPAQSGYHQVEWDGRDESGREVGTGMYIYIMTGQNFRAARKMIKLQ